MSFNSFSNGEVKLNFQRSKHQHACVFILFELQITKIANEEVYCYQKIIHFLNK